LPINRLCFSIRWKSIWLDLYKQWHSRVPCYGGKNNFARPSKKLLSCEEKNQRTVKSRKKQKPNICYGIRLYNGYLLIML